MRRIAIINQKGGVGKTTTTASLGAALAERGRRVVVVDMDAQANLSLSLGVEAPSGSPTSHTVLLGETSFASAVQPTALANLSLVPSNLDLSGAELELASTIGREYLLRDALRQWQEEAQQRTGEAPADYVLFDCPPSLGLLSINALAAAGEVLITIQTEFLALQGMSKLVSVVQLLRRRLNPELVITGILPCLYDSRLRLAREVLGEIRRYFPGQVLRQPIRSNVKLAEAPSFGQTIFQYAPDSNGADDYRAAANEVIAQEQRDPELAKKAAASVAPAATHAKPARAAKAVQPEVAALAAPIVAAPTSKSARKPAKALAVETRTNEVVVAATPVVAEPTSEPAPPVARGKSRKTSSHASAAVPGAADVERDAPVETPPAKRSTDEPRRASSKTKKKRDDAVVGAPARASTRVEETPHAPAAPKLRRGSPAASKHAVAKSTPAIERTVEIQPAPRGAAKPSAPTSSASDARTTNGTLPTRPSPPAVAQPTRASDAQPPRASDSASHVRARVSEIRASASRRVMRAEDLPALPPDAFEILSSTGRDR